MVRSIFFLCLGLTCLSGCRKSEIVPRASDPNDVFVVGIGGGFCFQPAYKLEGGELFKSSLPGVRVGHSDRPDTFSWILIEDSVATDKIVALRAGFPAGSLHPDNQRLGCSGAFQDLCCFFLKLRGSQGTYFTWFYEEEMFPAEVDRYFDQVSQLLQELSE